MSDKQLDFSPLPKQGNMPSTSVTSVTSKSPKEDVAGIIVVIAILVIIMIGTAYIAISQEVLSLLAVSAIFVLLVFFAVAMYAYYKKKRQLFREQFQQFISTNQLKTQRQLSIPNGSQPFVYGLGNRNATFLPFSGNHNGFTYDVFNYVYYVKNRNSESSYPFTIFHFRLNKSMPHLVLDSRKNDGIISTIPAYFDDSQRIELEGDFNKYFDLFAPKEYEIEALDILSPDFMQMLIDFHADFDIEIDDKEVYIIVRGVSYSSEGMAELFKAAHVLMDKFKGKLEAWSMAAMEKQPPDLIYTKGERAVRLGNWRITTAYFTIPLVSIYLLLRASEIVGFNLWILGAVFVATAVSLLAIRRTKRKKS